MPRCEKSVRINNMLSPRDRSVSFVTWPYGVGNRVIPIGCTLSLADELGYPAVVFWSRGKDTDTGGARFADLFDSDNLPFKLIDGGYEAWAMGERPLREKNYRSLSRRIIKRLLWYTGDYKRFPRRILKRLLYSQFNVIFSIFPPDVHVLMERSATDFLEYRKILIKSFVAFRYGCDLSWLKPAPHIVPRIVELKKQFAPNTVGVHLRGTDLSVRAPIEEYIVRMRAEVELNPNVEFFFTSDGDESEKEIIDLFGDRLIRTKSQARRKTIQGQQDAVVDLFGLAATSRIIGPEFSTFSLTAAMLSERPFLRMNKADFRTKTNHS